MIDYATHPDFNPGPELTAAFLGSVQRMQSAHANDGRDKSSLLALARQAIADFSPAQCRRRFGLRSGFSLAKEFYCEILATNAAAIARIQEQAGRVDDAKDFLLELYRQAFDEGFTRDREFLVNRLDSRSFMPMRNHVDRGYLAAIGYRRPDRALLCMGDCQTMIAAEMVHHALPLKGIDIAAIQQPFETLPGSPLEQLLQPAGYFFFVNCAANYAFQGKDVATRERFLDAARRIVAWLQTRPPRASVFVTHVFFGVDNAVQYCGTPREVAMDAVSKFSDDVAAVLAQAPNARLVNFQEICPFTLDAAAFRDKPDQPMMLHFRFDILARVAEQVAMALRDLGSDGPGGPSHPRAEKQQEIR